jgi:excisionase family DNA binding protein
MEKRELTVEEAAQRTGYSQRHIRRLAGMKDNPLKARLVGHRLYVIDTAALDTYVEEMQRLGTEKHAPY